MKNIAIDLRWVRDTNLDGISRYSIEMVKGLLRRNNGKFQYTLLFYKEDVRRMVEEVLPKETYESYMVPFSVFSLKETLVLPRILEQLNIDLFFSPNYLTYPFNKKTKIVLVVHDLTQYVSPETLKANLRWKIFFKFKFITRIILTRTDRVITVSELTKKDILRLFRTDVGKIDVIYNGVDKSFFAESSLKDKGRVREKYKLPKKFIVSVSRQDPRKNLPRLIRAYNDLSEEMKREYKLVIAGSKHPRFYPELERVTKHLRLENHIIFTGYVSDDDLPDLYQLSDLVVYPSFYEGFGLPVLEGMASGVPVITSNTSSLPEVAGDAAILVDPHKKTEITVAIERVLTNSSLKSKMIKKGLEQAKKFDWENTSAVLEKVFVDVLE